MSEPSANFKVSKTNYLGYGVVVGFWVLNLILSLSAKNKDALAHYHLTQTNLRIVQTGVLLPSLFIWIAMMFAVYSFYRYSQQIGGSKDSHGFRNISYGLAAVLISSISVSLINGLQILLSESSANPIIMQRNFVIFSNYVSVFLALTIYGYLYKGSRDLLASIGKKLSLKKHYIAIFLPLILLSTIYFYFIFSNPSRQYSRVPLFKPAFGLPDILTVFTVAIPYIVSWFLGMLALAGIYQYQSKTVGLIYKQIFKKLVIGLTMVIVLTIILQLIVQFSAFWAKSGLSLILVVIAIIDAVLIGSYILVAKGARQLNHIETYDLRKEQR